MRRPRRGRPPSPAAAAYRGARPPAGHTPWRRARFCVVDLETTGLDSRRDAIVAWSAVSVDEGRIAAGAVREGLARPAGGVPPATIRIHGLRDADLAAAPPLAHAADALLLALAGRVLVAHAAWVEREFLDRAFRARGARVRGPVLDTRDLGRLWLAERDGEAPPELPLGRLAALLRLPAHRPHTAAGDALTTAQALLALAAHLEALGGLETVRSLAAARGRLEAGRLHARFR